jgi:Coenzyme PQQ synthesis protein D (PqqD)
MIKLAPDLRSVSDQDGAVVLDNSHGLITTLDAMGGYIWRQLERGMAQEQIVRFIVEETGEKIQIVERDVQEFFEDLTSRHLLTSAASMHGKPETS